MTAGRAGKTGVILAEEARRTEGDALVGRAYQKKRIVALETVGG